MPSSNVFPLRRPAARSRCEHCEALVERVWLVPGDVLDSCANCWQAVMGSPPQPEHGHSRPVEEPVRRAVASFYLRADGRRPA